MSDDGTKARLDLTRNLDRLWADDRFIDGRPRGTELREFINAFLITKWQIGDHHEAIREARRRTAARHSDSKWTWTWLLAADAPRFEPHDLSSWVCQTVKTRGPKTGEPCGRVGGISHRVTDPETGEWSIRRWCTAHRHEGDLLWARERELASVPEPLPNVGGLFPSYLKATNWPDLYASARPGWKPPYVGIVADDWPILAKTAEAPRTKPQFTTITGEAEQTGDRPGPSLRLVTT
jgi:hypothetical protein